MLTNMGTKTTGMKTFLTAVLVAIAVSVAGCSVVSDMPATPAATHAQESAASALHAANIVTIDDGIAWARALSTDVSADELSTGITKIGDLVPDLDIWFQTNNEIGQALIRLNLDVLNDPANAGTKVDDLKAIVDQIEAAIEKGDKP